MDRVRFGRALGFGARQAVKTIMTAVDAATAESPSPKAPAARSSPARAAGASAPSPSKIQTPAQPRPAPTARAAAESPKLADLAGTAMRAATQAHEVHREAQRQIQSEVRRVAKRGVRQGAHQFKESAWKPFVRLSGVLWLEVTGVFFGVFALFALGAALRLRSAWHATPANAAAHRSLLGAVAMLAVFGYFCVSSFVRARRRERRR